MAFNVNEIRANLIGDGARPSLFEVEMTNPASTSGDAVLRYMVRAAQIPQSTINPIEVPYFGRKIKIAGNRTFAEWSVTVINDEDFLIRNAMESWMASINTHNGNVTTLASASPLQYKTQAQITQFSKTGAVLRTYEFNGLFPVEISAMETNWEADGIQEFGVTFQYDWWSVNGGITGDAGTQA